MNLALDPQRSVSVAASAGSGKTWQLVSRIVRLLLAGATPAGILALTFTRKAAAEMRERVEARLRELAYADDGTLDALLRQLDLEPDATLRQRARALHERLLFEPFGLRAQTLHAFCQDLLTHFAVEAGVPALFELIEDEAALITEAIERTLAELHARPASREAQALDTLIGLGLGEPALRQLIRGFVDKRGDWWAYSEHWQRDGVDLVSAYQRQIAGDLGIDADDGTPPEAVFDAAVFVDGLTMIHDLLVEFGGVGHLKAGSLVEALTAADAAGRGLAAAALLKDDGTRRALKIKKGITPVAFDRFMTLYDTLCTTLETVQAQRNARDTHSRAVAAATLGLRTLDHLDTALRARNALSFADLEWRSYRLLRDPAHAEWVRYRLDQRIDHLLLDEFQDTSPTQWALLLPLLEDMAVDGGGRRTAFIVGDAKQSIYGFRRANPELLGTAATWLGERLGGGQMPLNASRRSAPAIIDFVNALFEGADGAAIGFLAHQTHRRQDWGAVEVAALVRAQAPVPEETTTLRNPLTTPRQDAEDLRLASEAAQVAMRIGALIDAQVPVRDDDSGGARPIRYGDIMILARHRTHLHGIEQGLADRGIPFVGSSKGRLLETIAARDLRALLRFLDTPARDLDLAHTLRSPLFGASDDDLVALAREDGAEWWQRLNRQVTEDRASESLRRAARLLGGWIAAARVLPAHDLIDRIDAETGAAAAYEAALPRDRRVRINLGAFVQRLLDVDQGRYPTLGRLNAELERLADAGREAPDEAASGTVDAVRVLTIHASKGLEAAAVFLVNAAPTENNRHAGWLVDWPSGATRPRHLLPVAGRDGRDPLSASLVEALRTREQREALNLLYVAVTRARHYLFVSAFEPGRGGGDGSWHGRALAAVQRLDDTGFAVPSRPTDSIARGSGTWPVSPAASETVPAAMEEVDPRLRHRFAARPRPAAPSDGGPQHDPDAATRGIAIHWLIERLAAGRLPATGRLAGLLTAVCNAAIADDVIPDWLDEARRVVEAPSLARFFNPALLSKAWNEVPVHWTESGQLVSGVIDRLVDDGNALWIIDYKTAPRFDADALLHRHRPQLTRYAGAVAQLWPQREIRAGLIATARAQWIELPTGRP